MPNLDGGHYFLTVLAPVRTDAGLDPMIGQSRSQPHQLAEKLALMPTGRQASTYPADVPPSPFSRNTQNHFARLVIIDGAHFNGRTPIDALWAALRRIDPMTPQPVDELNCPYLLFAAEIDAAGDTEATLAAYAQTLWATMEEDLREIFVHCVGFEGVTTAEQFLAYLRRCQIETTLPFNDYWAHGLPAKGGGLPIWPLQLTGVAAAAATAAWLLAIAANGVFAIFGIREGWAPRAAAAATAWGVVFVPLALLLLAAAAVWLYRWIMRVGARPFPTAPGSDLPTILKSIHLQQEFGRFAIEAQGLEDAELHARFGVFLAAVRPDQPVSTQSPGEVVAPSAATWSS